MSLRQYFASKFSHPRVSVRLAKSPHPALPTGVDAIRILKLEPGDFSSPVVGTLTSVLFSDKPKYVALSYTWGDSYPENSKLPISVEEPGSQIPSLDNSPDQLGSTLSSSANQAAIENLSDPGLSPLPATNSPDEIILNGRPFRINHNLHLALLHLRSPTHPLTVWADAICINQENLEERNHQVSIMAFIYTRAMKVVAWLGTKDYGRQTGLFCSMSLDWEAGDTRHFAASLIEETKMHFSPTPDRSTFSHILESTYWKRLWIVQEICLPRLLVLAYGTNIWTYEDFSKFRARLTEQEGGDSSLAAFRLLETRDQRHTDSLRLESLIEKFAKSECSELRDRVYGLLGCANDIKPVTGQDNTSWPGVGSLEVNYLCSFYDIWTNVITSMYFETRTFSRNVNLPAETRGMRETLDPYFNERKASIVRTACIVQHALGQQVDMEVANGKETLVDHKDTVITAIGYIAGEVLEIGPDYVSLIGSSSANQDWTSCWTSHYEREEDLQTLRKTNEEYFAMILDYKPADLSRIRTICNPQIVARRYCDDAWDMQPCCPMEYGNLQNSLKIKDQTPRICLGTGNTISLVPPTAEPKDIVVRFWNCDTAILMRPTEWYSYMLVGQVDVAEIIEQEPVLRPVSLKSTYRWPDSKNWTPTACRPIEVNLDMKTLQKITAHTSTEVQRNGLLICPLKGR